MSGDAPVAARQPTWRLILFAFGDFGFNLYWQSLMLFLLFYYTDTLGFSMAAAAAIYMAASFLDGVSGFALGLWFDRRGNPAVYPAVLVLGAVPLGLAFVLAYLPVGGEGALGLALIWVTQVLFRLAYSVTNLAYLAMSARVSFDARDRSLVAGARMTFGAVAALVVSLATRPLGTWITGRESLSYLASALVFAVLASAILAAVGMSFRDADPGHCPAGRAGGAARRSIGAVLASILANRSFLSVAGAMVAMVIGVTMVTKSVLYYFKYAMGSTRAGELALAEMTLIGLIAVPVWMLVERRVGTRATWAMAITATLILLASLAISGSGSTMATHLFLAVFQGAVMGVNFALWALLPATVDDGEAATGTRTETALFGLVAMLQRLAIGVATGLLGLNLQMAGLKLDGPVSTAASLGLRLQISVIPFLFLAGSAAMILLGPRGRKGGGGAKR